MVNWPSKRAMESPEKATRMMPSSGWVTCGPGTSLKMVTVPGIVTVSGAGKKGGWRGDCAEPENTASPKVKIPESAATSQYPLPSGVGVMPTIGLFSVRLPVDP
jgi:hypothetical protein